MHPRCWCRIDWSGGKTADCSAMDLLDLWESIQFGPIEDEAATALHSPEPLRWVDPDLYRGFVSSSTSESGSDDSWGFWGPPNVEELARIMGREQDRADCMGGAESSGLDGTPASGGPAHRALVLPLEVIRHLPTFFDHAYLHALASSSRWMLCRVRDKGNWLGLDVDVDQRDLQQPHRLRGMVDLLTMARNVCVNLHQLSMFIGVPANLKVNWAPVPLPYAALVPFMLFGFQSEQPLLGAAEFDLVLPAAVRRLVIGVNEWGGHKLTYCSVDNVFRRNITWSIGLDDRPPMPHASASRFSPLPDCASRFALRWNERSFIIALNGEGVSRARLRDDEEDTAPPLSTVFVWAFGRARHRVIRPEVSTLPSPVQADSPIRCCICDRVHMLMHRLMPLRWRVCPVCTTWVCASHARQTPFRRCPNCIMQLGDFLGGASHADLTEAIQDYVFYQRIELVGRQALRYVHELTAFPELWALYPSPFAMPEDDRAWLRLLKIAAWRSSERATYMPPDVVVRRRPFRLTPELQRNLKKLVVVLDFMRQLIPYHEAVDTSLWPSPFDESVSKRQWENVFFNIRSAIRLLQKEADDVQSSDYKDGEHGVAERLTEGGACHTPGGSHPSAGNCQNRDYCGGSGQEHACGAAFEAFWPRTLQQMVGGVLSLSEPTRPPFVMSADPLHEHFSDFRACSRLAVLNSHEMDGRLVFESEGHKYFFDNVQVGTSASSLQSSEDFTRSCKILYSLLQEMFASPVPTSGHDPHTPTRCRVRPGRCHCFHESRKPLATA